MYNKKMLHSRRFSLEIKDSAFLLRVFPFFVVLCLCLITFTNFLNLFCFSPLREYNIKSSTSDFFTEKSFFLTFYSFFLLYIISAYAILFIDNFYSKILFYVLGLTSACLMAYSTNQTFTLKLFIYVSFLICTVYGYKFGVKLITSSMALIFFSVIEAISSFSAAGDSVKGFVKTFSEINSVVFTMTLCTIMAMILKQVAKNYILTSETVRHQNLVMNQMSELNNKLQEYAKNHGEEAVQNERMRITRDMHDSCGYAFVNITAIIDAIMSNPEIERDKLSDTLLTVRNLASNGLKETRKTLRQIREVESPSQNNLTAVYEIKRIFQQITGINVDIQSGNLKENYGITINAIIMHTLQEGLTNAIRHGRAKNIYVTFWDDVNLLTMVIKDDGIGSKEVVKGIGLAGMEERLNKVMGKLEVSTPKEGGFRLEIKIPLVNIAADELKL